MGKFELTGCGFVKKGAKLLRHWGSKEIGHSEALVEESFLKGTKLLGHYGTKLNLPLPTGEVDFVSEFTKPTKSGEGTIFKMLNRAKKKCAFTLSEVLIVLAVLGVVAAMTIPDLIQDYREKALITALKKNYSIFSQAVDMAIVENGPMDGWDIGQYWSKDGSLKLYNILKPYLRIEKECTSQTSGCFADHYEALFNENFMYPQPDTVNGFARGVLASGASFHILSAGTGCIGNFCGYIGIDVNGKAGPNKAGVDYFYFDFTKDNNGLTPGGQQAEADCKYDDNKTSNGWYCTYWALKHENMDYLRKDGCYYADRYCR